MEQQILELSKKLISIPSTNENKDALIEVLEIAKNILPEYHFEAFASGNIPSLLFSNSKTENRQFKIILNAHLDVVPGTSTQYIPLEKDGKLFGRGAYDMKSAAAVMILLYKEIAHKVNYPLALQLTTDEESSGAHGTAYQVKQGVRSDFILTGEGTNFRIINESKSMLILKLISKGKSSHGAYPWLGENAVWKMQQVIHRLYETYPPPKSEWEGTTFSVTSIHTENKAYSKIPDLCEATVDVRAIHQERIEILNTIKKIVSDEVEIEIIGDTNAHQADPNLPQIKKIQELTQNTLGFKAQLSRAHGTSDIRHYTAVGCEGIEFGPIGSNQHSYDEWVDIKSLYSYYTILKNFLLSEA